MTEAAFLQALADDPRDDATRLVYADWLEERGDVRAELLRLQVRLKALPLGTPENALSQARLREVRRGCDPAWLRAVEPLALLGELTPRGANCLKHLRVGSVAELHDRTEVEVLSSRGFGETFLRELREKLAALGLSLEPGW